MSHRAAGKRAAGRTALYAFSAQGLTLALGLAPRLGAHVFAPARLAHAEATPFGSIYTLLAGTFRAYGRHVFVGAAGIAVRAIAPFLRGKALDPAVAVLDQQARFAVSLLSGHLGRANELARELAALTGAAAIITTATDVCGLPSVDGLAAEKGMAVANLPAAKAVSAALLEGRRVQVFDPEGRLLGDDDAGGLLVATAPEDWDPAAPGVWCHWRAGGEHPAAFRAYPRCLCLGLGSRKGTPAREIRAHIGTVFAQEGLAMQSLAAVGTADIKREDPGICEAMRELGAEGAFFAPEALAAVDAAGQSETVRRRTGTGSVCEAAALLLAAGGPLVAAKAKTSRVTCAVALRPCVEGEGA